MRFLVFLLLSGTAFAGELQLDKIALAAHQTSYSGTYIYQRDGHVESSRLYHLADGSGEYERRISLDGPPREIIRNNEDVQCFFPDEKAGHAEIKPLKRGFPFLLADQIGTLSANYSISPGEKERVAGFDSQVLFLVPKDGYRYGHKLWVENNTNLLLKAAMIGEEGQVIEQFIFTQLAIGGFDKELLKPAYSVKATFYPDQKSQYSSGWEAEDPPPGFRKITEMKRNLKGKSVTHMVYSDGIVAVSVFIEPLTDQDKPRNGMSRHGPIHVYANALEGNQITVVGEAPVMALERIGNSLSFKRK